ncbi:hypothetical protein ACPA9J_07060 [Pseudomonas aeruginosa]
MSLAFCGMSHLRRPDDVAIKTVNALSHYTDWTIGHVHAGALGWSRDGFHQLALPPDPRSSAARRCTAWA